MSYGLDRKDHDEIMKRAKLILEARKVNRYRQRTSLTQRQLTDVLGDECGMSHVSRVEDERQRRQKGGG